MLHDEGLGTAIGFVGIIVFFDYLGNECLSAMLLHIIPDVNGSATGEMVAESLVGIVRDADVSLPVYGVQYAKYAVGHFGHPF